MSRRFSKLMCFVLAIGLLASLMTAGAFADENDTIIERALATSDKEAVVMRHRSERFLRCLDGCERDGSRRVGCLPSGGLYADGHAHGGRRVYFCPELRRLSLREILQHRRQRRREERIPSPSDRAARLVADHQTGRIDTRTDYYC